MENKQYLKVIVLSSLFVFFGCHVNSNPGRGKKIGKIVKLSKEGVFSKTWEGELIRGGLTDGSGTLGTSFEFTIEDEKLVSVAFKAFENQSEVILTYRKEYFTSLSRSECSSPSFVERIEIKDSNGR